MTGFTYRRLWNSLWDRPANYHRPRKSLFPVFTFCLGMLVGLEASFIIFILQLHGPL